MNGFLLDIDGQVIIGELLARSLGLKVGDRLDLSGSDFRVGAVTTGRTYFAGVPTVIVSLREAQRLALDGRSLSTAIVTEGRPASTPHGFTQPATAKPTRSSRTTPRRDGRQTVASSWCSSLTWKKCSI